MKIMRPDAWRLLAKHPRITIEICFLSSEGCTDELIRCSDRVEPEVIFRHLVGQHVGVHARRKGARVKSMYSFGAFDNLRLEQKTEWAK